MQRQDAENDFKPAVKAESWLRGIERKPDLDDDPNDMQYTRSASNPLTLAAPEKPAKEEHESKFKPYNYENWPLTPGKVKLDGEDEFKVKLEDRSKHEDEQNSNASIPKGEGERDLYVKMSEYSTHKDVFTNLNNASRNPDSSKITAKNDKTTASWDRSCIVAHESRLLTKNLTSKESKYFIIIADDPRIFQPPAKRARMVFDGVHVPPLSPAHKRKVVEREREYYRQRLKLEKGKEKFSLSNNSNLGVQKNNDPTRSSYSAIQRLGKFDLDPVSQYLALNKATREAGVTRAYMASEWGGSPTATRPAIRSELLAVHGLNDFMYVNPDSQPYAPENPGAPGAYLCFDPAHEESGVVRLLVKSREEISRRASRGAPLWFYVGQYLVMPADPPVFLSAQEWRMKTPQFRDQWAKATVKLARSIDVCARIRARKELGREPTPSELAEVRAGKRYKHITRKEVEDAYCSGQEKLSIWIMKCVGYDKEFQLRLSQDFPSWVRRESGNQQLQCALGLRPPERKRVVNTESEFEPGSEDLEEDDTSVSEGAEEDEDFLAVRKSTGHFLRPRKKTDAFRMYYAI